MFKGVGVLSRMTFVRSNSGLQGDKNVMWRIISPFRNRGDNQWQNSVTFWLQNDLENGEIGQRESGYMFDRESFPFADSTTLKVYISGH